MNPGQRIAYIKDISDKLGQESWALIDLTLKQFGLPSQDRWDGQPDGYIIQMIQDATDEKLEDLAHYLGISYDMSSLAVVESLVWQARRFRLFISHTSKHKDIAESLQKKLKKFYISSFVAHTDIEPTKEWQDEILQALLTADAILALLTDDFSSSNWTDQEVGIGIGRGLLILPIRLGKDPYGFIGKYQALNSTAADSIGLEYEILKILLAHKLTKKPMAEALVTKFEDSDSFQDAKDNVKLVEQIKYSDDRLIERIKSAVSNNGQIGHSFRVPERVAILIKNL